MRRAFGTGACTALLLLTRHAAGDPARPTPGYPEPVVQWGVQKGETCEDISKALYGSPKHVTLLHRYNRITCKQGTPLPEGLTLVLPEKVTTLPDATLRAINPDVRARPAGGGWGAASAGMPLYTNAGVNTLDKGRADIEFIDRTRVYLAPNTLVVIYGTASRTRVSHTPAAAVEVEAGELRAGLAALRGDSVEVAVKGGGQVSALSRDTVVQRKGDRTTVAVFDGKAGVKAGGKAVEVPTNYGTRFVGNTPPVKPRPLPPAPEWEVAGAEQIELARGGSGVLHVQWKPSQNASAYRVELARDPEFRDILVRQEVPPDTHVFHAEKMPIDTYYLHVRAIDKEEYLGVAAQKRLRLVEASGEARSDSPLGSELVVSPYGTLSLKAPNGVALAIDQGAFGPPPPVIDLRSLSPKAIRLKSDTGAESKVPLRYIEAKAIIKPSIAGDRASISVEVTFEGLAGIDVPARVAPVLRAHGPSGVTTAPLKPGPNGAYLGVVALPKGALGKVKVDVADGRGAVLGSADVALSDAPQAPAQKQRYPHIGAYVPLWQPSSVTDVLWISPTPANEGAVSVALAPTEAPPVFGNALPRVERGPVAVQGQIRASGAVGPVGLEALIRSSTTNVSGADGAAWLGARVRVLRLGNSMFELAPSLRVGVPTSADAGPVRFEPALALGGAAGMFTWLANVGARVRAVTDTSVPAAQGFLLAGGSVDPLSWMRVYALIDAHLVFRDGGQKSFLGGLGAGIEAGTWIFGGLSLRASPWTETGLLPFQASLAIGIREAPPPKAP